MAGEDSTWGLSGGYKAPRVKAGTVVKAPSTYQGSPYAQGQDMFTVAPIKQLATTSQDILVGKGTMQGLATPITNTEGLVGKTGGWSNLWNGSQLGGTNTGMKQGLGSNSNTAGWGNMLNSPIKMQNDYLYSLGDNWASLSPEQQTSMADGLTNLKTDQLLGSDLSSIGTHGQDSAFWGEGGIAGGIAGGIGAAANLANAYIGYKNYGLAKDKFGFEKAATNRNIENQAQQYNTELQNRTDIGLALGGSNISPEQRANTLAQMERQKISGAALG